MNVSTAQGKRSRLLWGLLGSLALGFLVFAGVYVRNTYLPPAWAWKGLPHPTWDGVPTRLDAAMNSLQYRDGGAYLPIPGALKRADRAPKTAYAYRVVVDLLRSLTPEQIKVMRRQVLPFSQLTRDQQNALMRLDNLTSGGSRSYFHRSAIFVFQDEIRPGSAGATNAPREIWFCLCVPSREKDNYGGLTISLPLNGAAVLM